LTGAEDYLDEAHLRCEEALQAATKLATDAKEHYARKFAPTEEGDDLSNTPWAVDGWGIDFPVHLSACVVIECSLTEAEV
jgi:hypothetical protein